ncbi:hypothetical protein BJY52DRAFT_1286672 [Lactarius psammicola]|nr:hypothetical protein BJY52DRAFT_1286672 [Lactarius psammicola]
MSPRYILLFALARTCVNLRGMLHTLARRSLGSFYFSLLLWADGRRWGLIDLEARLKFSSLDAVHGDILRL